MSRSLVIAMLMLLVAGFVSAQNHKEPVLSSEQPVSSALDKAGIQEEALPLDAARNLELRTAMNEEINARLAVEKTTIGTLAADLDRAVTSDARLATQRRISQAKQTAWRDILAIQLKYAHLGGFTEQADELEKRIARLDEGLSKAQPVPTAGTRQDAERNRGGK